MRVKGSRIDLDLLERVTNTDGVSTALSTAFGATANKVNVIEGIMVVNTSATPGYVDIRDGTAGAILVSIPLPANNGGMFDLTGYGVKGSVNTAIAFDVSAALSTIIMTFFGYKA